MKMAGATVTAENIRHYARLEQVCKQMLDAARGGDWNRVASIEGSTHALIAYLREHGDNSLERGERLEKFRILRNILQIDAEIRHLSHPWQQVLDEIFAAQVKRPGAGCTGRF